ncbi:AAA family ATPase [Haliscomenobacter sp.]|uniref:AAA family ATPase n=1 Tax=Haliscomenobacter sp. TaxID=2717303 RepID=UPI003364FAEB
MIEHIEIYNFKSIKELELDLKPINVLIGANGVGKSNFISFFKLLKNLQNDTLNTYVAENGYMDNLVYFGHEGEPFIQGQIVFSEELGKPSHRYELRLTPDHRNLALAKVNFESSDNLNVKREGQELVSDSYTSFNNTGQSVHLLREDEKVYKITVKHFNDFYVYHFHDTSFSSPLKKTARLHDNVFLREDGSNLPAFLYFLQERHPKILSLIEKVVHSIAPFFEKFILKPDRLNGEYIQLEWQEVGHDRYQNAHNLSDGTLRFIALTTLMLQPEPPKIIIIDEPELGLHPSAIEKLAGLVRKVSAKSQVILATQSIQLVNNFEPEDIIVVDRDREKRQSIFTRADEIQHIQLQDWLDEYGLGEIWFKGLIGGKP